MTDPNFQGIDPQLLAQLTSSLGKGVSTGQQLAASYLGQFGRLGLDTGAISKLMSDFGWAQGQQSMLQRRYALASHQPASQFVHGMATAGAGTLQFPTAASARQAGSKEGGKLSQLIAADDWAGVQAELKTLAANNDDPDYMAALFKALGPSGLFYLSADYNTLKDSGHGAQADQLQNIVGQGLSAASYEFPLTQSYIEGLGPKDFGLYGDPGGNMLALTTFLTVGTYSTQWLKTLSPYVLYQEPTPGGDWPRPGTDAIFQAIANNPGYAAQFFQQNPARLANFLADPLNVAQISNGAGFAAFVKAATIPPRGAPDTSAYTANAKWLIEMFGQNPGDRTSGAVRRTMVGITTYYWNDVFASVTAAAPGADGDKHVGLGIPAQDWGNFVQEAMRDPSGAAQLLAFYGAWDDNQPGYNVSSQQWKNASAYFMRAFFAYNYLKAGEPGGNADALASILADAGAAAFGAIVFPEGEAAAGGMALVESALTEAEHEGTKAAFGNYIENAVGSYLAPGDNQNTSTAGALLNPAYQWADEALKTYNNDPNGPASFAKSAVHDPGYYEGQFGGNFIGTTGPYKGKILPLSQIQGDPQALAAFNAWLQDPGVSTVIGQSTMGGGAGDLALAWSYMNLVMSGGGGG